MSDQPPPGDVPPSRPFNLQTIKPGAVCNMTTDKLASFSLGATKKTQYQVRSATIHLACNPVRKKSVHFSFLARAHV